MGWILGASVLPLNEIVGIVWNGNIASKKTTSRVTRISFVLRS